MVNIDRHHIDREAVVRQSETERWLTVESLDRLAEKPNLGNIFLRTAKLQAGLLWTVGSDTSSISTLLKIGARSTAAIFRMACQRDGNVQVLLSTEDPAWVPATGPASHAHEGNWRDGFYMAAAVRNTPALMTLVEVPIEVQRAAPGGQSDEFAYWLNQAFAGWYKKDPATQDYLLEALRETDSTRVRFASEDYVLNIVVPVIDLFYRMISDDRESYNEAMKKALECHREYWGTASRAHDPEGFLALGPLAVSCLAYDNGLVVDVSSDYIPRQIITG